jgi:4-amino-4-deoxy-L-arabinose transferase-like glycosyltransferase
LWPALALLFCLLAMVRPVDHDESQYVAAAALVSQGLLPYRDLLYLQTPLQPFLFAPLAWAAGAETWPALRLANALLGAVAVGCTWRAARLVAPAPIAAAAALLFAGTDILLFASGTARNDALPAACLAGALWCAIRAERGGGSRAGAALAGVLLAAATAAKVSYALPALAYGLWALARPAHRPAWVALGALPIAAFVGWSAAQAPAAFWFGVITFPLEAPDDWYAGRPWKLSPLAKAVDTLKFLALGAALPALIVVLRRPRLSLLLWLLMAGLIAGLAPTPTWRQYLLPALPPLFVALAARWAEAPPGRAGRAAFAVFALAGLAPSLAALASGAPGMASLRAQGRALRAAMDRTGVAGPVATLSPQVLPATGRRVDPRFAAGPFYFRSRTLSPPAGLPLLALRDLHRAPLPAAVLVGGEDRWTSGDPRLDAALAREAARRGYVPIPVAGTPFRLWVRR